jgi:hypothetical protein
MIKIRKSLTCKEFGFLKRLKSLVFINILPFLILITAPGAHAVAANPPKELQQIIDNFMNLESTSMEILQVIDWKYRGGNDSVKLQMDILGGQSFHLELYAFGMEIYVDNGQMMTINHARKQIIYESTDPDALLNQLFAGGDLNNARYRGEKRLKNGNRQLTFHFDTDFSDWESLSIILDNREAVTGMELVDYDGNNYSMSFLYLSKYSSYTVPNLDQDFPGYKIADLRK